VRATPSHVEQGTTAMSPVVVALVKERASAARLVAAFRPTTVRLVHTVPDLSATLHEEGIDVVAVLAEGRDAANNPTGPVLATLIARFPGIPFLGYCGMGVAHAEELRELAKAGVHELVFRDLEDSPALLRAKLGRGIEARAGSLVLRRLSAELPEILHGLVSYTVSFPRESHEMERVALALGVHRKTLVNWCRRAGVPPPSTLVTWVRLLLAVEILQTPGHTVERVAHALEFASGSAFRNLCQRYLGHRPADLRCAGGREAAYRAFANALHDREGESAPAEEVQRPRRSATSLAAHSV
jgi:AraC-like DNA-binding protein